jgi:hypothetical protein
MSFPRLQFRATIFPAAVAFHIQISLSAISVAPALKQVGIFTAFGKFLCTSGLRHGGTKLNDSNEGEQNKNRTHGLVLRAG